MGWYGSENIAKYYSIGFTEKELEEIDDARKKQIEETKSGALLSYLGKPTNFIRYLALTCLDLKKENQQLKNAIRETRAQSQAIGQNEATTWTGYFRGVKTDGNIVFPEWG